MDEEEIEKSLKTTKHIIVQENGATSFSSFMGFLMFVHYFHHNESSNTIPLHTVSHLQKT